MLERGSRVRWTRRGETFTGTVDWEPYPGDDRVSVKCDPAHEMTVAAGVPIGRIEHPRIEDLEVVEGL